MQHIAYDQQLQLKQRHVLEELDRCGVEIGSIRAAVAGPRLGYRTKARLGVRMLGEQILTGFRETLSNRVARMNACLTLVPEFSQLLEPLRVLIAQLSQPARIPQVELAAGDHDRAIIIRHLEPLTEDDERLMRSFALDHHLHVFSQSGGYETVRSLSGSLDSSYLGYANDDFGLYYRFRPWDFTQVNLKMNRALVRAALTEFGAPGDSALLDLFCGIGNFSLAAAALGWRVTGFEAAADAIERANMNAALNGLSGRCEFHVADLYDPGCSLPTGANNLLLDPPRSGAGPNLANWIDSLKPGRVVYVSCQPSSFAADSAILQERGYRLERVGIYDMFPNTAHIETLGSFSRRW
jgi:23S rRNA (uracil1939-C5)-methyltransferase